jgi:hypothetical protein
VASTLEIVPRAEADMPQLSALAKETFAGLPGWSGLRSPKAATEAAKPLRLLGAKCLN